MSSNAKFTLKMPNRNILDSNILPQSTGLKSTFDLSEGLKTTLDFDGLYPVYWEELNPGDHFEMKVSSVCRLMPTVAPVMDNIKLKYFAFWVPNRLLWKNFLKFMGEKTWQDDSNDYVVPQIKLSKNRSGLLSDYLGVPPVASGDVTVSALPFRAYRKIWNDWFRATELQEPVVEFSGDQDVQEVITSYGILKKGKPLDYFTSCLPYPQSGEPVTIPLAGNAPVFTKAGKETWINTYTSGNNTTIPAGVFPVNTSLDVHNPQDAHFWQAKWMPNERVDTDTNLYADMSNVTGISIQSLRKAAALQVLLERDARAGERYPELVKMHYGVTCPDFLLGRSQFLGSCTSDIVVNPVVQQSSTDSTSPQGHLTGIGVGQESDTLCEVSAVEHGIFMVLACVTGDVNYQQGLPRKFSKISRFDYMNPAFWNIGDQAVLNQEIYLSTDKVQNEQVFGYQERYRELREGFNKITGKLRSGVSESLDVWHLAEHFSNLPKLNSTFIQSNTPINRVLAVQDQPDVILDIWFDIKATRPLPVSSNPSMLVGKL